MWGVREQILCKMYEEKRGVSVSVSDNDKTAVIALIVLCVFLVLFIVD